MGKIIFNKKIEKVFPLFSALEEKKWVQGWNPEFIYPIEGDFIENSVFKTKSKNDFEMEFNWITSYLNTKEYLVIYTVFTENRVWTIKVKCEIKENNKTEAEITYTFTGLNQKGNEINSESLEKMYKEELKDWEVAINHFLETGKMLRNDQKK